MIKSYLNLFWWNASEVKHILHSFSQNTQKKTQQILSIYGRLWSMKGGTSPDTNLPDTVSSSWSISWPVAVWVQRRMTVTVGKNSMICSHWRQIRAGSLLCLIFRCIFQAKTCIWDESFKLFLSIIFQPSGLLLIDTTDN